MAAPDYDVMAATGEYADRQTGEAKTQWTRMGVAYKGRDDKLLVLLDPKVSLAGVSQAQRILAHKKREEMRDMVAVNLFPKQQQSSGQAAPPASYDDDITF